jgi:NAD-dependent dihydropyrimidine dehydrogenase PreA subunit
MGVFIQITLTARGFNANSATALADICPVDIFALTDGQLTVRPDQEDECTLCELCLQAAPSGAVTIRKLYKDEVLRSHG